MPPLRKSASMLLVASVSATAMAAVHSDTTAFNTFKSKLEMHSGQTYLGFMKKDVKPAIDDKDLQGALQAEEKAKKNQYSAWQTDLIEKGEGVAIRIDSKNYFFNVGYGDGSNARRTSRAAAAMASARRTASRIRATLSIWASSRSISSPSPRTPENSSARSCRL